MFRAIVVLLALSLLTGCKKDDPASSAPNTSVNGSATITDSLAVYKKVYGASSITSDGTWVTFTSMGVPDHKSVYFATSDAKYEAFSGTTLAGNTFRKNPNTIVTQSYTFKIPRHPAVDQRSDLF